MWSELVLNNTKVRFILVCLLSAVYTALVFFNTTVREDAVGPSYKLPSKAEIAMYKELDKLQANPNFTISKDWCSSKLKNKSYAGPCSHELFRSYYSVCAKFPTLGTWQDTDKYKKGQAKFTTPLCKVHNVSGGLLEKHIARTGVQRFLMVGDSHGVRYFTSLANFINASGYDCQKVIQESGAQSGPKHMRHYLTTLWKLPVQTFRKGIRGCVSCRCTLLRCTSRSSPERVIELEFLGIILTTNFILPNPNFCKSHKSNKTYHGLCSAKSENELIFKHYLRYRKPDFIIISTTSSHDFRKKDLKTILPVYKELKLMVAQLKPRVAMWIPSVTQRHVNITRTKKIALFNEALFSLLGPELKNASKSPLTLSAFDNTAISQPLMKNNWSKDRVHYHQQWYDEIMMHLMSTWVSAQV